MDTEMSTQPVEAVPLERPSQAPRGCDAQAFLEEGRRQIAARLSAAARCAGLPAWTAPLLPGKMLRTRMAARLYGCGCLGVSPATLQRACAAAELAHAAGLCHQEVRGAPGRRSGAVLLGGLLLCEAMDILARTEEGRLVRPFMAGLLESCTVEAQQELRPCGGPLGRAERLRIARSRTGPLFAFVGLAAAGDDAPLATALREAGYQVGTACRLAQEGTDGDERPGLVRELCAAALRPLHGRPPVRRALTDFLRLDFEPLLDCSDISSHAQVDPLDEV
jgi:hypothetical protein